MSTLRSVLCALVVLISTTCYSQDEFADDWSYYQKPYQSRWQTYNYYDYGTGYGGTIYGYDWGNGYHSYSTPRGRSWDVWRPSFNW